MKTECSHYYSKRDEKWVCEDGKPLCSDHVVHLPCPYCKVVKK